MPAVSPEPQCRRCRRRGDDDRVHSPVTNQTQTQWMVRPGAGAASAAVDAARCDLRQTVTARPVPDEEEERRRETRRLTFSGPLDRPTEGRR